MWLVLLSAGASGSNAVVKWVAGRQRPFRDGVFHPDPQSWMPFRGGLAGLVHQSNLSFPSGHTTHAFALATAVAAVFPRWGWAAYVGAMMTAFERVLSNSHYPSEVFAGAVLGAGCTLAVLALLRALSAGQGPESVPLWLRPG
jgi:membrane-associated phospholipid phosphatase